MFRFSPLRALRGPDSPLPAITSWMLAVFLAGFMVAWETRVHRDVLYLGVFLPALLFYGGAYWRFLGSTWTFRLLALFLGYLVLSLAWGPEGLLGNIYDKSRYALIILGAVAVTGWVLASDEVWLSRLLMVLLPVGAVVLIYSVLTFYGETSYSGARLQNQVFYHQNPNSGAVGFYLLTVLGAYGALAGQAVSLRVLGFLALVVGGAFLVLAQSRGLLAGAFVAIFLQLLCLGRWKLIALLVLALNAVIAGFELFDSSGRGLLERGDAKRLEIWAIVVERILAAPIIGHGISVDTGVVLPSGDRHLSPHNFLLMVLLVGGIVGAGLLMALVGRCVVVLRDAISSGLPGAVFSASLMAGGLVIIAFDGHDLITRIHPHLWLGLWLPLGAVLALEMRQRNLGAAPPAGLGLTRGGMG